MIPLRPIGAQIGEIVDVRPQFLRVDDVLADGGRRAGRGLQVARGGEMVGVRMRVEDPLDLQSQLGDVSEDRIGAVRCNRARFLVEVEHGVDDRAGIRCRVRDDIWMLQSQFVEARDNRTGAGLFGSAPVNWPRHPGAWRSLRCLRRSYNKAAVVSVVRPSRFRPEVRAKRASKDAGPLNPLAGDGGAAEGAWAAYSRQSQPRSRPRQVRRTGRARHIHRARHTGRAHRTGRVSHIARFADVAGHRLIGRRAISRLIRRRGVGGLVAGAGGGVGWLPVSKSPLAKSPGTASASPPVDEPEDWLAFAS